MAEQLPDSPFTAAAASQGSSSAQDGNLPDSPFSGQPVDNQPMSGKFADWYFSNQGPSAGADVSTIMSHIGQGAEQGWGAGVNTLSKTLDQALTKAGVYKDKDKPFNALNPADYFKSINEALVRPVVNSLATIGSGALGGIVGGFQGVGTVLQQSAKSSEEALGPNPAAATVGVLGEYIGSTPERVPDIPLEIETPAELTARARSKAVVGEGEQGFFNTKPVSDENLAARQSAAQSAGTPPEEVATPEPPQMDIHQVVRQMDPALFDEVDRLNGIKSNYKDNLSYAHSQDMADVERELAVEQSHGTNPDRVAELNSQLDALKSGEYGPRAQETQATFLDNQSKLFDLQPEVSSVYKHAQEIMMTPEEIAEDAKLANPRLQDLTDKISTDGLTPSEWNEYNVLSKAQDEKAPEDVGNPIKAGKTEEEGQVVTPKIASEGSVESGLSTGTEGPSLLKPLSKEAGEQKVPGVSKNIEAAAVEKGLTKEFIGKDNPTFTSTTVKYQSERIAKLMSEDPDGVKQMINGTKEIPGDIVHQMLYAAVRDKAEREGDLATIKQLVRSPLAVQKSLHAQALGMSSSGNRISPTDIIKNVEDARRSTKKLSKGIIDDRAKLKAAKQKIFTKEAIKNFLKEIQCEE